MTASALVSRMSPYRERHRCDSPCQAQMNSVALRARQGHASVCVSRVLVLYHLGVTHNNVSHVSSQELPARGYCYTVTELCSHSRNTQLRGIMPGYTIIFAIETLMVNPIRGSGKTTSHFGLVDYPITRQTWVMFLVGISY